MHPVFDKISEKAHLTRSFTKRQGAQRPVLSEENTNIEGNVVRNAKNNSYTK